MKCQKGMNKRYDIGNLVKPALFWLINIINYSKTLLFLFLFISFLSVRTGMDCVAPPLLSQIETVLFIVTVQSIAFVDSLSSSVCSRPIPHLELYNYSVEDRFGKNINICWFSDLTWTHNWQQQRRNALLCCKSLIGLCCKEVSPFSRETPFLVPVIAFAVWTIKSLVKLQTLHAFGVCVCGEPATKKETVFYTETLTAASHCQCLWMPFLDLKAGLAPSPECATVYFSRSGKCDLSCSLRGFLELQQQRVMIFNVKNVIGTLSYATVIPACVAWVFSGPSPLLWGNRWE